MAGTQKEKVQKQVNKSVEGCTIDWANEVQVNRETGQKFDFEGNLIEEKE